MRKRLATTALCLVSQVTGCRPLAVSDSDPLDGVDTTVESGPSRASDLPPECRPTSTTALQSLYDVTESSVHELITCGGLQMKVALSMKLMIFASNERLVSASARRDIGNVVTAAGLTVDNPFTQASDGSWVMGGIDSAGSELSTFDLRFFDPDTAELVTVDPFRLDSYLVGATVTSDRTWEQMKASPTTKTTFTYAFEAEGPLAHLLANGGTIPNPFQLRLSLLDLGGAALGLTEPDYGPFASVQELLVDSRVHLIDERGSVRVTYDVTGAKDSLRGIAQGGSIGFDIDALAATDGTLELSGSTSGLAFLRAGSLAGEIRYSVGGSDGGVLVTSDFGAGAAYPTPRWECP